MAGEASFSSAEAVLDEVAMLEAALQDAVERRRAAAAIGKSVVTAASTMTGSPFGPESRTTELLRHHGLTRDISCTAMSVEGPVHGASSIAASSIAAGGGAGGGAGGDGTGAGIAAVPLPALERFDAATAAYGVKLKSWIDLQVDQRLGQVVRSGLLQGELLTIQREHRASLERHVEMEIEKVKGTQSRLLGVVQTVSEELAHLQAQGDALVTVEKALEKVMVTVEELKQHMSLQDTSSRSRSLEHAVGQQQEAVLLELRAEFNELRESARHHSEQLHSEASDWQHQCRQELAEHVNAFLEGRAEMNDIIKMMQDLEDRVATLRADVKLQVAEELSALRAEALPSDKGSIEAEQRLATRVQAEVEAVGAELLAVAATKVDIENSRRELHHAFQDSQSSLKEELVALQKRLVAELRAETTAAFRSESASVAALDEQLWLTDQRLGQRIDELAHAHHECVTVVERRNGKERMLGVTELSNAPAKGRALRLAEHAAECAVDEAAAGSPQAHVDLLSAAEAISNGGTRQTSSGPVTMAREAAETLAEHLELRRNGTLRASADKLTNGSGGMTSANASHVASAASLRSAAQGEDAHSQLAAELHRPMERPLRSSYSNPARARRDTGGSSGGGRFPFRRTEVHPLAESMEVLAEDARISSHFPALRLGQRT